MPFTVVPYFKRDLKQASIRSLLFWCGLSSVCVEMNTFASDNKQCRCSTGEKASFFRVGSVGLIIVYLLMYREKMILYVHFQCDCDLTL